MIIWDMIYYSLYQFGDYTRTTKNELWGKLSTSLGSVSFFIISLLINLHFFANDKEIAIWIDNNWIYIFSGLLIFNLIYYVIFNKTRTLIKKYKELNKTKKIIYYSFVAVYYLWVVGSFVYLIIQYSN